MFRVTAGGGGACHSGRGGAYRWQAACHSGLGRGLQQLTGCLSQQEGAGPADDRQPVAPEDDLFGGAPLTLRWSEELKLGSEAGGCSLKQSYLVKNIFEAGQRPWLQRPIGWIINGPSSLRPVREDVEVKTSRRWVERSLNGALSVKSPLWSKERFRQIICCTCFWLNTITKHHMKSVFISRATYCTHARARTHTRECIKGLSRCTWECRTSQHKVTN